MSEVKILDRETKANFEIKVINKTTGKSKTLSLFTVDETEESLKNRIKESLDSNKNFKDYRNKGGNMTEEKTTEESTESETADAEEESEEESEDSEKSKD